MREQIKGVIGESGRSYVRRLGRLRYLTKSKKARAGGWSFRSNPSGWMREVLLSPEVDTFSYEIDNRHELAVALSETLDCSRADVDDAMAELAEDPEFGERLTRDVGHRVLWLKRRPGLASHHVSMWVAIRMMRPKLVVETGILEGLGSRVMLRALQRNAQEGDDGRLVSFDIMPKAGLLVPARLADRWTKVVSPTPEALDAHLGDAEVDVYLFDSVPDADQHRAELTWALAHGVKLFISPHEWTGVTAKLAEAEGARYVAFADKPRDHFFGGRELGYLRTARGQTERSRPRGR